MIGGAIQLETPEGIDLEIEPAGPVPRGLAILIDGTITMTASTVLLISFSLAGAAGYGVFLLAYFLIEWFYPVLFEVLRSGQTPGKRALGLRVVHSDATPIGWNASLIRNLLRTVDFFPLFYLAGLVSMLVGREFRRLGDLAARTLVIHSRGLEDLAADSGESAHASLGTRTVAVPLSPPDQRALLAYAERHRELSVERAIELADVLEPLTQARGEAGLREVLRVAAGIAGDA